MCFDMLWCKKKHYLAAIHTGFFQKTLLCIILKASQICDVSEDPRDICIDQGFTFTHTPPLSLAVIQGLFGLAFNSFHCWLFQTHQRLHL